MPGEPDLTLLERTKIHAEVLVPLVKELTAEIGAERARSIVRRALGRRLRDSVRAATPLGRESDAVEWLLRTSEAGDALDHRRLEGGDGEVNFDVTRCSYAEFFEELGEPELGFLLVCSLDFDFADALDGVALERSQTIMQGASHCDFRFRLDGQN